MDKTRIKKIMDTAKERYPGIRRSSAQWAFIDGACWADSNPRERQPWHSVAEEPEKLVNILADNGAGSGFIVMWANQEETWQQFVLFIGIYRWAYMFDILGEE